MSARHRAALPPRRKTASRKLAPRKTPAAKKPAPRTNSAHYTPARRKPAARRRKTVARKAAPLRIRQPPPPRAADPLARKTGRRRTYYTPEFLAEAKRRIETTLQSTQSIAGDLGIDHRVLWRLVRREGWVRPEGSLRLRSLPPAMRIAMQVDAMVNASAHSRESGNPASDVQAAESAALGPRLRGDERSERPALDNTTIDRFEAAVLNELATVETMRANLGKEPQRPIDAERTARTLSVLTETMGKLQRQRLAAQPQPGNSYDDMPADIDEFRNELARRIDALIASEPDEGSPDGD